MKTPVEFPIAKLLKEKGYDNIRCSGYYDVCEGYRKGYAHCYSDVHIQSETAILAPTIADVIMWLYEKHKIWISVFKYKDHADDLNVPYLFRNQFDKGDYDSPKEAYEAGIKYTLKNLIK